MNRRTPDGFTQAAVVSRRFQDYVTCETKMVSPPGEPWGRGGGPFLAMWRLAPYVWYGFIFASSCKSVNGKDVERQIQARFQGDSQNRMMAIWKRMWWLPVKGWHATEFGILYALFRKAGFDKASALAMVGVGAALDEYHQTFVEGRTGTPRDVMIDLGGAVAAMGIEGVIEKRG